MKRNGSGKIEISFLANIMIMTILKVKNFSFPRTMLRAELFLLVIEEKKVMLRKREIK